MKPAQQTAVTDKIQQAVARLVATSSAGHNLPLIGGFRYRFLDRSVRTSRDIDYHWSGDLGKKQQELIKLFRKRLLPGIQRQLGYEGRADPATGPDAESPAVCTVALSFWKSDVEFSRIEIPVEITRVVCADPVEVRTVDGIIYPTLSDVDLIESKIIAVFGRRLMEHRDLLDIFLFAGKLAPDSPKRLKRKMKALAIVGEDIRKRLDDLKTHAAYHTKAIQAIVDSQFDPEAAGNINGTGGAKMIQNKVLGIIRANILPAGGA
ncbi:MAG: hypothetical protein HY343_10960 [Lentisphaerae bacterium]|nr:hypothetical protein [Lentisphaerota bacterium]